MVCITDLQLRHNLAPRVVLNSYSYATHSDISQKGPSIKYVTLFWTNFDSPPSVTLCHTSWDLLKYVTHLGPPIFSSTCMRTCLYRGFVLVRGGFCLEGFVRGGFCPSPLLSEYIHHNSKLNITFNFSFHMYKKFLKCDVPCSWTPLPLSQTVTPSRTPLERDVLYGRPLSWFELNSDELEENMLNGCRSVTRSGTLGGLNPENSPRYAHVENGGSSVK